MNIQSRVVEGNNPPLQMRREGEEEFLNQIRVNKKRQYFVGSREAAEKLIQNYVDRLRAGEDVPPNERIAGVLCVGNYGTQAVENNLDIFDGKYLNLAGKTDLTCDPMQGKRRTTSKERVSRTRVESPQTVEQRRCTALDAYAWWDESVEHNKHGIFVIHCEHGLHRSTAYAFGMVLKQKADRIVMDHFDRATDSEKNFTLDMTKLVNSAHHDYWMAFGKPRKEESSPHEHRPYPRIKNVFKALVTELYTDLKPAMPRPYRMGEVKLRIQNCRNACPC